MSVLDTIIEADQQLLIFLNNFGATPFDNFWLYITKPSHWIPLALFWIALLFRNFHWKKALILLIIAGVMGGLSDQLVEWIKHTTLRPRPCWQEGISEHIRKLKCTSSYSFVSGHATTSMAIATYMFLVFKNRHKWSVLFFIFPLLFAYSRIYMGKHYPADILCGYLLGITEGILYFRFVHYLIQKLGMNYPK